MFTSVYLLPAIAMLTPVTSSQFLPNCFVVEAQVFELRIENSTSIVTLKVMRVYSGPSELKDITFSLNTNAKPRPIGRAGIPVYNPPLAKSEKGIWLLQYQADMKLEPVPFRTTFGIVKFPARNIEAYTRYKQADEWAKAVESVANQKLEDRPPILRELTLSKTPEVAAWAVEALAADESTTTSKFLDSLVTREGVVVQALIALDTLLSRRLGKEWTTGKQRIDMIQRMTQATDEFQLMAAIYFLNSASTVNEFGFAPGTALRFAADLTGNLRLSAKERSEACWVTRAIAHRAGLIEDGFNALFARVETDPDIEVRRRAASLINGLIDPSTDYGRKPSNLSPSQLERINKQLKIEKDIGVINALNGVMDRSKKK